MRRGFSVLFAMVGVSAMSGCPQDPPLNTGSEMEPYFPFDGRRSWQFINEDALAYDYLQLATLSEDFETIDVDGATTQAYTLTFVKDCVNDDTGCADGTVDGAPLWAMQISADSLKGVLVHSYSVGDAALTPLDPPLRISPARQVIGGSEETSTDGVDFSSTFTGYEDCPVQRDVRWPECVRFDIDGGGATHPLVGTFWAITTYGIVSFDLGGSGLWKGRDWGYCADGDDGCEL